MKDNVGNLYNYYDFYFSNIIYYIIVHYCDMLINNFDRLLRYFIHLNCFLLESLLFYLYL